MSERDVCMSGRCCVDVRGSLTNHEQTKWTKVLFVIIVVVVVYLFGVTGNFYSIMSSDECIPVNCRNSRFYGANILNALMLRIIIFSETECLLFGGTRVVAQITQSFLLLYHGDRVAARSFHLKCLFVFDTRKLLSSARKKRRSIDVCLDWNVDSFTAKFIDRFIINSILFCACSHTCINQFSAGFYCDFFIILHSDLWECACVHTQTQRTQRL